MTPLIQDGTYPVRRIATLGPRVLVVQVYLQPPFPLLLVPVNTWRVTQPFPGLLQYYGVLVEAYHEPLTLITPTVTGNYTGSSYWYQGILRGLTVGPWYPGYPLGV